MRSEQSGWREILEDLTARIAAREWAPGETIPPETQLARSYGCARATVNRALTELARRGAVERRRRSGTRVSTRGASGANIAIPLVGEQITALGAVYTYRMIGMARTPQELGLPESLTAPDEVDPVYLLCLHLADGAPFQLEGRWINMKVARDAAKQDFAELSPNEWLVRETPWSHIAHGFRADRPQGCESRLLMLCDDEPVFIIERRTWLGDAPITRTRLAHPGYSYVLESRI